MKTETKSFAGNSILGSLTYYRFDSSLLLKTFAFLESQTFFIFHHHGWIIFILTPCCFLIASWLVIRFAPYARTSGMPQVMAAIELANPRDDKKVQKLLSIRIFIVKVFSAC